MGKRINIHNIFLFISFLITITYAYFDFWNSANSGIKEADRVIVYILLFLLIGMLTIYMTLSVFRYGIKYNSISTGIIAITTWIILVGIIKKVDIWLFLVHIGLSILWLLIFSFGKTIIVRNAHSLNKIKKWIFLFFIFYVFAAIYANYNMRMIYDRIPVVNLVYNVMIFYPWLVIYKKPKIKKVFFIVITVIVLISFKRGAIVIFPLMILFQTISYMKIKSHDVSEFLKLFIVLGLFVSSIVLINIVTDGFLQNRFTIDSLLDGSGRNDLFSKAIINIKNRSIIDLLTGFGSGGTIKFLGTGAHNEWIEFLFNFGFIGLALYLNLMLTFIRRLIRLVKIRSQFAPAYSAMITYYLIIGAFGGFYFVHSTLFVFLFFGVVEGLVILDNKTSEEIVSYEKSRNINIS